MQKKYRHILILSSILIFSIFIIYFQTKNFEFIAYDDGVYVQSNTNIKNGINFKSIKWAFSSFYASNYHPITWLSLMLDYGLYGNRAGEFHTTNVLIHIINSLLLFFLMIRVTQSTFKSFFVALLFALHPLHIESVAWVSERKDLLCALFYFLSIYLYVGYVKNRSKKTYWLSFFAFILSLLSKPMAVTLPIVLILLDYYPLNRKRDGFIKDKIPFLIGTLIISLVTIFAQKSAMKDLSHLAFHIKTSNAMNAYFTYIYKTFIPINLAILYPHSIEFFLFKTLFYLALFIFITSLFFYYRKKKPYLIVSWLFYIITLLPVIGFIQVGGQAMADRYTYIPLIGVFIIFVWLCSDILKKSIYKVHIVTIASFSIFLALSFLSFKQVAYWKSSLTLFKHTIKVTENINEKTPTNIPIRNNLSLILINEGKLDEAYEILTNVKHTHSYFLYNIGRILIEKKEYTKAIKIFTKAIEIGRNYEHSYVGLAIAYNFTGQKDKAIQTCINVLAENSHFNMVRKYLISLYTERKEPKLMLEHLIYLYNKYPNDISILMGLGVAYGNLKRFDLSEKYFLKALKISPNDKNIKRNIMQNRANTKYHQKKRRFF